MRFSTLTRSLLAGAAVLALGAGTASAQATNFSTDVSAAIDAGLAQLAAGGAYANPSNCGDGAGLCALALLEKRASADPDAAVSGYAGATPADKARLDLIMAFIIPRATANSFYSYRDGADSMALSVYLRTGGPNQVGALAAVKAAFDRINANQNALGYWCYFNSGCNDASTTQLVMAGLAATRGVFSDPAYADPARLASLNSLTADTRAGYVSGGTAGGPGGVLEASERGHGYNRGDANSIQQTASGTWAQIVGGADLNDSSVQAYLRWIRNRYRYSSIYPGEDQFWSRSFYYYLWSSSKAYSFLDDSDATPDAGNLSTDDLGALPPASAPAYARRELHRDPLTDSRPAIRGAGGPGYYGDEVKRWYYDYAYTLMSQQIAGGTFVNPDPNEWNARADQSYALLVLQRSVGGGCIDSDGDSICDSEDNCPAVANLGQEDSNNNGVGDACEVGPVACDVDADGDIDLNDLTLIRAKLNTNASSATDPRDGNRDGRVNVADIRFCSLKCTRGTSCSTGVVQ